MSTATPAPRTLDVSRTPRVPFWRLVAVEFRKSYDTRAGFWLLFSIAALVTLLQVGTLLAVNLQDAYVDLTTFTGNTFVVCLVLVPMLGILLVTSEWSQRSAMVTFVLEPNRLRVVLAKLVVGTLLALATVALMFAIAFGCTALCELLQPELTDWNVEWQFVLVLAPIALIITITYGFALAALLLNTPGSIVVFLITWLVSLPILFAIAAFVPGFVDVIPWIDFQINVLALIDGLPAGAEEWAQLLTSTVLWIVLPLGGGIWRILHAEVK